MEVPRIRHHAHIERVIYLESRAHVYTNEGNSGDQDKLQQAQIHSSCWAIRKVLRSVVYCIRWFRIQPTSHMHFVSYTCSLSYRDEHKYCTHAHTSIVYITMREHKTIHWTWSYLNALWIFIMKMQDAKSLVELEVDGRGRYTMLGLEREQAS